MALVAGASPLTPFAREGAWFGEWETAGLRPRLRHNKSPGRCAFENVKGKEKMGSRIFARGLWSVCHCGMTGVGLDISGSAFGSDVTVIMF